MKTAIAFYSFPQECGDDSLRIVSCSDGQIVADINLTPQDETEEKKVTRELLSETAVFYDRCVKQRFDIGDHVDDIPYRIGTSSNAEGTEELSGEFWNKHDQDYLTILQVEDLGESPYKDILEYDPRYRVVRVWKYTVALTEDKTEYIYHPEWDTVYQEIKEKFGIECTERERWDREGLANKIADAMGYKLLNILYS